MLTVSFLFLFATAVVFFIELGRQLEMGDPIYFSGMMKSVLIMFGVSLFGGLLSIVLGRKPKAVEKTVERTEAKPEPMLPVSAEIETKAEKSYRDPLLFFADEFLKEVGHRMASSKKQAKTPSIIPMVVEDDGIEARVPRKIHH